MLRGYADCSRPMGYRLLDSNYDGLHKQAIYRIELFYYSYYIHFLFITQEVGMENMFRYVSPINPAIYPQLSLILLAIGVFFMAWFFVYPLPHCCISLGDEIIYCSQMLTEHDGCFIELKQMTSHQIIL